METNRLSKLLQITNNVDKWAGGALKGLPGEGGPQWYSACSNSLTVTGFKILGVRRVTCSRFLAEDPQILGPTVYNLVATATRRSGLGHPCEVWSCSWWWWWWLWLWFLVVVLFTVWDFRRRWRFHLMVSVRHKCHVNITKQLLLLSLPILTGLWTKESDVTWSKIYPSSLQLYRQHVWGRIFSSLLDDACSSISAYYPSQ